ncbi:hypothetical protein [Shewanella frigidimarina]|uniref:hypothetical protein n=1 Tax=Shewanella frigidimarina TaxID=56812 RepID=UPI003D79552F
MTNKKFDELFNENRYKEEANKHNEFLYSVLGIIAFTLALSCLGFEHPQRPAMLCLAIILPIYLRAFRSFPSTLYALRSLAKETKDLEVIEAVKYLENKYHGIKSLLLESFVLFAGLSFYLCVLIYPEILAWFKK